MLTASQAAAKRKPFEPVRKLSDEQIDEMGQRFAAGESITALGRHFDVSPSTALYHSRRLKWEKSINHVEIKTQVQIEEARQAGQLIPVSPTAQDLTALEAQRLVSVMKRHRDEWGPIDELRQKALYDEETGKLRKLDSLSLTELKKLSELIGQLHKKQLAERIAWGIEHHENTQAQVAAAEATAKAAAQQATATTSEAMTRVLEMRQKLIEALNTGRPITIIDNRPDEERAFDTPVNNQGAKILGRSSENKFRDGVHDLNIKMAHKDIDEWGI